MKEITVKQLEIILQEYCEKHKIKYREVSHEPKHNKVIFGYTRIELGRYGLENNTNENYCMELDDNYRFISVKRGLTKQLMGVKVLDVESISKSFVTKNWG